MIRRCRTGVGPARILDERQCLPVADVCRASHDQSPIDEHRVLVVDGRDLSGWTGERHGEPDASLLVPRAVDETNRGRVGAVSTIDAGHAGPADHELIDMRLIAERRSPSTPPVVSIERCRGRCKQHTREREQQQMPHASGFVDLRGAGKHRLAAAVLDRIGDGNGRKVTCGSAGHTDAIAGFQRIASPSTTHQGHRAR